MGKLVSFASKNLWKWTRWRPRRAAASKRPTCREERECREIIERLGIPNCFVCRGLSTSIALDTEALDAEGLRGIWPEVLSNTRQWNSKQAN